jgi:hypothetical protein
MPMLPEAPERLSMTMRVPSCAPSGSAISRAAMSTLPPGGNGEISLIGWLGKPCAATLKCENGCNKNDASLMVNYHSVNVA